MKHITIEPRLASRIRGGQKTQLFLPLNSKEPLPQLGEAFMFLVRQKRRKPLLLGTAQVRSLERVDFDVLANETAKLEYFEMTPGGILQPVLNSKAVEVTQSGWATWLDHLKDGVFTGTLLTWQGFLPFK
jgi:hypothetical protein